MALFTEIKHRGRMNSDLPARACPPATALARMEHDRCWTKAVAAIAVGLISLWLWAEGVDFCSTRRKLGSAHTVASPTTRYQAPAGSSASNPRSTHAVVVLGYGNRGERANTVNRFRVRAGIRSLDPSAEENLLVLCGGTVEGPIPEAILMQRYAREELHHPGLIAADTTSRSTRENIAHAVPFIEHADTIAIVSHGPHAELGREILWRLRPDLATRLVRGAEHRFGEAPLLKILAALRAVQSRLTGAWRSASGTGS
ncbi:YdcF family protein [Microbacterium sp.]|uniref:YdcF family protein n=1 Tax=Microbacterium sp. TaxID=51671 RepID=UPI003C77E4A8